MKYVVSSIGRFREAETIWRNPAQTQRIAQRSNRFRQLIRDGLRRDVHHVGDLFVREIVHTTENENLAPPRGQRRNLSIERLAELLAVDPIIHRRERLAELREHKRTFPVGDFATIFADRVVARDFAEERPQLTPRIATARADPRAGRTRAARCLRLYPPSWSGEARSRPPMPNAGRARTRAPQNHPRANDPATPDRRVAWSRGETVLSEQRLAAGTNARVDYLAGRAGYREGTTDEARAICPRVFRRAMLASAREPFAIPERSAPRSGPRRRRRARQCGPQRSAAASEGGRDSRRHRGLDGQDAHRARRLLSRRRQNARSAAPLLRVAFPDGRSRHGLLRDSRSPNHGAMGRAHRRATSRSISKPTR